MALGWRKEYSRYKEFFLNIIALYRKKQDLRMFLEILLSLTTISFFTIFAIKPTLLTITELYKEIKSKEEIVAKMDLKIQNIAAAQALFAEEPRTPLAESSVPTGPTPEAFVRQVEGLAFTSSVNLLGVSIGEVTMAGEEKKMPESELTPLSEGASPLSFSLSVTGEYSQLSHFLSELENLRRPIRVDHSGLTSSKTEEGGTKLVLLVSGRVPYLGKK